MTDFVAIDFETANGAASSVCAVGIVVVKDNDIADRYYSLIHPTPNYYSYFCQQVHGIDRSQTEDAPCFPEVWKEVENHIGQFFPSEAENLARIPFVAHNARFDENCLREAFKAYCMDYPDYVFIDTLRASRREFGRRLSNHQLQTVAAACGFDLRRHHHALADAEACAAIAQSIL